MGDRAELLGYCEAALFQPRLRCGNLDVQRAFEVGAGERDGEGDAETGVVQLIDGDDGKRAKLRMLTSASGRDRPNGPRSAVGRVKEQAALEGQSEQQGATG